MSCPMPRRRTKTVPLPVPVPVEHGIPRDEYPTLSAALDSPDGEQLRVELEHLLGHALKKRAPRREVRRIARLRSSKYDEVVLIKDLSTSGVRLLVQGDQPLDMRDLMRMELSVKLPGGRRMVPISAVRICGQEGPHIDLGCRFLVADAGLAELVEEIRSYVFGD